jgi:hypothetical protein
MDVSSCCGSLATTCASSYQQVFIGNSTVLQWSDVRLTKAAGLIIGGRLIHLSQPLPNKPEFPMYWLLTGLTE